MNILLEFIQFLIYRRKYWLWPLSFILLILGLFIMVAHSSAIAGLIYTLF